MEEQSPKKQCQKVNSKNLMNQIVHRIIKQQPSIDHKILIYPRLAYQQNSQSKQKNYPTIKTRIQRLTKDLFKEDSESPKKRKSNFRSQTESTQIITETSKNTTKNLIGIDSKLQLSEKLRSTKDREQELKMRGLRDRSEFSLFKEVKRMELENLKKQKHFEKIIKVKEYKMKKYLKNKFAIDTKTIQTDREQKFNQKVTSQNKFCFREEVSILSRCKLDQFSLNNIKRIRKTNKKLDSSETNINKNQSKRLQAHIMNAVRKQVDYQKHKSKQKDMNSSKKFNFSLYEIDDHPAEGRFKKMIIDLNKMASSFNLCLSKSEGQQLPTYSRHLPKYKYYVGPGNNRNIILLLFKKRWWWVQTKKMEKANFIWTQNKDSNIISSCLTAYPSDQNSHQNNEINKNQPSLIFNHYPGNNSIGNKKELFLNLKKYCHYKNYKISKFIPDTFYLQGKDHEAFEQFQKKIGNRASMRSVWVLKPGENSNRGNGIQITKSLSKIKSRFLNLKQNQSLIVQKYISNPLLYNKRKFDIRVYMIAVTLGSSTKYFWYQEGYIRTSSFIFSMDDLQDVYVHLTNDAIQSESESYGKYELGNKLSYKQFQRYLQNLNTQHKTSIQKIHKEMKEITLVAIQATYPLLNLNVNDQNKRSYSPFCFELFGLDFMLTQQCRPYLIQVNTNPCLETGSPCLQRLIPLMVDNLLKIGLDTVFQPTMQFPRSESNHIPQDIFKNNKFQLLFDQSTDKNIEYENIILQRLNRQINQKIDK